MIPPHQFSIAYCLLADLFYCAGASYSSGQYCFFRFASIRAASASYGKRGAHFGTRGNYRWNISLCGVGFASCGRCENERDSAISI